MLEELKSAKKVVGIKQLRKALNAGSVKKVFIAEDADPLLTDPIAERCRQLNIPVISVPTMKPMESKALKWAISNEIAHFG